MRISHADGGEMTKARRWFDGLTMSGDGLTMSGERLTMSGDGLTTNGDRPAFYVSPNSPKYPLNSAIDRSSGTPMKYLRPWVYVCISEGWTGTRSLGPETR